MLPESGRATVTYFATPRHLVLRYMRAQTKKVEGWDRTPVKMTLRSQSQGLPHPDAQANAAIVSSPWVLTIVAFHQAPHGNIHAKLHWTHPQGEVGENIPLHSLRSTFPDSFPRSIPDRPDSVTLRIVVDRLDRLHGPHTIDLFATAANRHFQRYGSKDPEKGEQWHESL